MKMLPDKSIDKPINGDIWLDIGRDRDYISADCYVIIADKDETKREARAHTISCNHVISVIDGDIEHSFKKKEILDELSKIDNEKGELFKKIREVLNID